MSDHFIDEIEHSKAICGLTFEFRAVVENSFNFLDLLRLSFLRNRMSDIVTIDFLFLWITTPFPQIYNFLNSNQNQLNISDSSFAKHKNGFIFDINTEISTNNEFDLKYKHILKPDFWENENSAWNSYLKSCQPSLEWAFITSMTIYCFMLDLSQIYHLIFRFK